MKPTKRDMRLLRALNRGEQPRGSNNDVDRLNKIVPGYIINRAYPLHEPPYLFLHRMVDATRDPSDVLQDWLTGQLK